VTPFSPSGFEAARFIHFQHVLVALDVRFNRFLQVGHYRSFASMISVTSPVKGSPHWRGRPLTSVKLLDVLFAGGVHSRGVRLTPSLRLAPLICTILLELGSHSVLSCIDDRADAWLRERHRNSALSKRTAM